MNLSFLWDVFRDSLVSNPQSFDVVIVGGGPAGTLCALTLAKDGHSVAILDKKQKELIGDKTCGDALDLASVELIQKHLAIDPPAGEELSDPILRMKIAAEGLETHATLTAPGFLVDRLIYGQRLLTQAESMGVTIFAGLAVRNVLIENDKVIGVEAIRKEDREKLTFHAKFVVDASGAYGAVRKHLPARMNFDGAIQKTLSDDMVWPTYREIIEFHTQDHIYHNEIILEYETAFPVPGYFWVFSKGEKQLNVGLGWLKSEPDMGNLKEALHNRMALLYDPSTYSVIKSGGGQIPIRPPFDNLIFPGGVLVGDAACLVHPTTAEGHGPALESGMLAGRAISQALRSNDDSLDALWEYNQGVMERVGVMHAKGYLMRKFLERITPKGLELLLKREFISDSEFDKLVRGEFPELSTLQKFWKVLKLFPKFGLVRHVQWMLQKMDRIEEIYQNYPTSSEGLHQWREERNFALEYNF